MRAGTSQETIAAVATPIGEGGIGVVRLSGPRAPEILAALFAPRRRPETFASHQLCHGWVRDPEAADAMIDEVLAVRMHAPNSYTGEEVVEIHGHGSPLLLSRIVALCVRLGAREARPGEFTERAFLNGRLDLAQAEAVADLIAARTERAQRQALEVLRGSLSVRVRELAERLRRVLAHVEVEIDFSDDDAGGPGLEQASREVAAIDAELAQWLAGYRQGRLLREGARVALVGAPNAGKSSLFNALLAEERALVHAEPGTTRDRIEEWCNLDGLPVRLVDTAGLREASGIEGAGVALARRVAEEADLLVLVIDAAAPMFQESARLAKEEAGRTLEVANKMDLPTAVAPEGALAVSARTGQGIGSLRRALAGRLLGPGSGQAAGSVGLTRERHRRAVAAASEHLGRAQALLKRPDAPELAAAELRGALAGLSEIAGESPPEEILRLIFSEFCIGK